MGYRSCGLITLFFVLLSTAAWAYSPVARFDVVPYQRIEYGSSFKVGVIAFSKPGIEKVEFTATGQGYSGGTKTSTAMSLNTRTSLWEYWVEFPASDFTGNGAITITATVTDNLANTRILTLPMIAEGASAFTPSTCWADSVGGNNSTCTADDSGAPCADIATCISKLSDADGAIIYLEEGTYTTNTSATTTTEWLTLAKSATAAKENVIINTGRLTTGFLKYDSVTIQSQGAAQYVTTLEATRLWTNNTRIIGSGRNVSDSNPIHHSDEDNHFSTNDYTYNVDYAYRKAALIRGADINYIGNDATANVRMLVGSTIDDIDNTTGAHADVWQVHTTGEPPADNRIMYNVKATDVHIEGIFMRSDAGQATDNAFVNVIVEMREPATPNESGLLVFTSFSVAQSWDHLIVWNCSFLTGHSAINTSNLTNSSIIGNFFWQAFSYETAVGNPVVTSLGPSNAGNNEVSYNHYEYVYSLNNNACTPGNSRFVASSWPCPQYYAKAPDSNNPVTYTYGGGELDTDYESASFTYPVDGSALHDRFTTIVPIDVYNAERGALSSIGAVESFEHVISGTIIADDMTESTLVTGGATLDVTLNDAVLEADISAYRAEFIAGCVSSVGAGTLPNGWNAEIVADEVVTAVTRVSDTVLRWTLSANAAYAIDQNDGPITCYVPNEMIVDHTEDIVPTPTFSISNETPISLSPVTGCRYSAAGSKGTYSAAGASIR